MAERRSGTGRRRSRDAASRSAATARELVELAQKNAAVELRHRGATRARTPRSTLAKLQRRLKLTRAAARDRVLRHLAHPGLRDGGVDGGVRRRAAGEVALPHLQGRARGDRPDDFASMYEVLSRRFRRAREVQAGKGGATALEATARDGRRRRRDDRMATRVLGAARPDRDRRRQGPAGHGAGGGARRRHRRAPRRGAADRRPGQGARRRGRRRRGRGPRAADRRRAGRGRIGGAPSAATTPAQASRWRSPRSGAA